MKRILALVALIVAAGATLRCQRPTRDVGTLEQRDAAALGVVRAQIARQDRDFLGRVDPGFDPGAVRFQLESSAAVTGVAYWWGTYAPPRSADVSLEAVAARGPTEARLLRTPTDWFEAARAAGWRPATPRAVLDGCGEAVMTAGPRGADRRVRIYRDSFSVANHDFGVFPESARSFAFHRRLEEARAAGDTAHGFTATFWELEPGEMVHYRCVVRGATFRLDAIDSLNEMGLLTFP